MVYHTKSGWVVGYADHRAEKEVDRLPEDMLADLERITDMIEQYGLERVHTPYVKHLSGKLWEIRVKGRDGIARALYVTAVGKQVKIVHVFIKKTNKTPTEAIALAVRRAKELGLL